MRILFVLKKKLSYGHHSDIPNSGLLNSVSFTVDSLKERGVHAKAVVVQDNNCLDREITKFKPNIVVIEALWVVPSKFDMLKKLHPHISWYVHLHSHIPFLANEGIAMEWIRGYIRHGVKLIVNSKPAFDSLRSIVKECNLIHLDNCYIQKPIESCKNHNTSLHVGCFGAIRPLKNHLLQAMAAIKYSKEHNKVLFFHINSSRVEQGGGPILKNLRQLFKDEKDAILVEVGWLSPHDFIEYLSKFIDIGMQVSLSETFNVVSADYVTAGLPIVTSKEISWASRLCKAKDNDIDSIVGRMDYVIRNHWLIQLNKWFLKNYNHEAAESWFNFVHLHRQKIHG